MKVQLLSNTAYGKIGDVVNVSPGVGERMIQNRDAMPVVSDLTDTPAKRGPGRPPKIRPENKSVGA